jgi:hypothetical protein
MYTAARFCHIRVMAENEKEGNATKKAAKASKKTPGSKSSSHKKQPAASAPADTQAAAPHSPGGAVRNGQIASWARNNSGRIIAAFTSEANRAGEVRNYTLMDEYLGVIQEFRQVCGLPQPQQALTAGAGR